MPPAFREAHALSSERGRRQHALAREVAAASLACLACAQRTLPPADPSPPRPDDPAACTNIEDALPNLSEPGAPAAGRLDPEVIRSTIRDHYDGVRRCYESGLARHPKLAGRITMRFAIEADGKISDVIVSDNELADCVAVECVRSVFGTLEFPPPEGGVVTVQYPLSLEPG